MLEEVSSLLEPVIYSTRCGYRGISAPKISLVNEVQCGTGTEWRGLIGQQGRPEDLPITCWCTSMGHPDWLL